MKPGFNVVLITVDTLRKDHLPTYGYPHDTAPFLAKFAEDSVTFDRMYSQYVCTPPAMASLMTGRVPSFLGTDGWNPCTYHGLSRFFEDREERGVPRALPVLAERFKGAGFGTAALMAHNIHLLESRGFAKGFDHFEAIAFGRTTRGSDVVRKAVTWLDSRGQDPFFVWLHFMDVHPPIQLPPPFDRAFPRGYMSGDNIDGEVSDQMLKMQLVGYFNKLDPRTVVKLRGGRKAALQDVMEHYQGLYDGAIHFLDMCLENLFSYFKRRGLYDRTLWAFTSDHGEEFLEEGHLGHYAYSHAPQRLVEVPFILRPPGIDAGLRGKRISGLARQVDVFPTLMEAAGLPCSDSDGASLWPMIAGTEGPERLQHMNLVAMQKLHIIYSGDVKYVYSFDKGWEELTDLRTGKAVEEPSDERVLLKKFRAERDRFVEKNKGTIDMGPPPPWDLKTRENLRALGYIE